MSDPFAQFRSAEPEESGFVLVGNTRALAVCAAWRSADVRWDCPTPPETPIVDLQSAWYWIWEGVTADIDALARATGMLPRDTEHTLRFLITNRFIYPDKTLARVVAQILNREIKAVTLPSGL